MLYINYCINLFLFLLYQWIFNYDDIGAKLLYHNNKKLIDKYNKNVYNAIYNLFVWYH